MESQHWIAVVDDDASLRASLVRILICHGMPVAAYASAREYLARTNTSEPQCIVLDVHMESGMNGFELQEHLESLGPTPPIIFMTGHQETIFPLHSKRGAPVEFLRKPFDPARLIALVQKHLQPYLNTVTR